MSTSAARDEPGAMASNPDGAKKKSMVRFRNLHEVDSCKVAFLFLCLLQSVVTKPFEHFRVMA